MTRDVSASTRALNAMLPTPPPPTTADPLYSMQRLLRAAALGGVLVVLLVTTSSAFLRLRALGLGCEDWPACYAQGATAAAASGPSAARILHRISATLAGAAVLGVGLIALGRRRELRRELALAAVMLFLLAGLAWLGRATPGARVPAVALGNVLGGLLLAALLWWLALGRRGASGTAPTWLTGASWAALLLTFAQIGLGVLTSASHSGLACTSFPGCSLGGFAGSWSATELDPWRQSSASASIHMAHRVGAVVSAVAVASVAMALRRRAKALTAALGLLLAAQVAAGIALVLGSLPLPVAVLHNVLAAGLLLALVAAHHRIVGLEKL
jgi:cytochrome c oxidase assembly protein subunit 15